MGFAPRSIDLFTKLDDTPQSYIGQAGEFVRVNSGETGLEFVPASSIVLSQYLLKAGDTASGQIIFDAGIKLNDNDSITLGTGNDALIFYDGTNLVINPASVGTGIIDTDDHDIRCGHIGVADTAPGATSVILGTLTSSSARQVLNFTLTYTGTTSANAIVATGIWSQTSTAPNMNGIIGVARLASANTTGGTINALQSQIGFSGSPVITAGTHEFNGLILNWNTNGGTHTGGTLIRRGIMQSVINSIAGMTNVSFGAIFNNDVQLNSGVKLILDGPSNVALGDTYIDSNGTTVRHFLNGTQEFSVANGFVDALRGLKISTGTELTSFIGTSATLDFPSTATLSSSDLTITLTGAQLNDTVILGVPNGSVIANTCYTAWVSATNTITVRFNNYGAITADPASGTFKVGVFQY